MTDVFNYSRYQHHIKSAYYEEIVRTSVPPEHLLNKLHTASFILSDTYPVILNPTKTSIHYNDYKKSKSEGILKEKFIRGYDKEIRNAFDNGFEYLVFIDNELVANSQYIYSESWCSQPISMYAKASQYLFVTLFFPFKDGAVFYLYHLRNSLGAKFLELYHGGYFSSEGGFTALGLSIISNMIRLTYNSDIVGLKGLQECFNIVPVTDMTAYNILKFRKREAK